MSYRAKPIISERRLNGQDYSIYIFVSNQDTLTIGLELLASSQYWSSTFSKDALSSIIAKTKLQTNFKDFVELLISAITNPNRSETSLELYTTDDIERTYNSTTFNTFIDSRSYVKRYLILSLETSIVGKVSYPLPLSYHDRPDSDYLFAALARSRRNGLVKPASNDILIDELKAKIEALEAENSLLKAKLVKESSRIIEKAPRREIVQTPPRSSSRKRRNSVTDGEFVPLPLPERSSSRKRKRSSTPNNRSLDEAMASLENADQRMNKLTEILMNVVQRI